MFVKNKDFTKYVFFFYNKCVTQERKIKIKYIQQSPNNNIKCCWGKIKNR